MYFNATRSYELTLIANEIDHYYYSAFERYPFNSRTTMIPCAQCNVLKDKNKGNVQNRDANTITGSVRPNSD